MKIRIAAILGFLGIVLGASGAHGHIHDLIEANGRLDIWRTAVQYHLIHAVLLYILASQDKKCGPFYCILAGVLLFSGSLYILALTNIAWLGAITPFGGLSFIAGWLWLAIWH